MFQFLLFLKIASHEWSAPLTFYAESYQSDICRISYDSVALTLGCKLVKCNSFIDCGLSPSWIFETQNCNDRYGQRS